MLFVGALVVGFVACENGEIPFSGEVQPASSLSSAQAEAGPIPGTLDARWENRAEETPGFAGYYVNHDGAIVVQVGENGNASAVRQAAKGDIRKHAQLGQRPIVTNAVKYDFSRLAEFERKAFGVLETGGAFSLDISEKANMLVVENDPSIGPASDVRQFLEDAGIPTNAYRVVTAEQPRQLTKVWERYRNVEGGLKFGYGDGTTGGSCTGVFASTGDLEGPWGLLTNSHCTGVQGGTEGSEIYQRKNGVAESYVGLEQIDPQYQTSGSLGSISDCSTTNPCRYSDAAWYEFQSQTDTDSMDVGWVVATKDSSKDAYSGNENDPVTTIADWSFEVRGVNDSPVVGVRAKKIGGSSGWTYGKHLKTCSEMQTASGYQYPCSTKNDAGVEGGDSGSPVLELGEQVDLYGVVYAGTSDTHWFSPLDEIEKDFGVGELRVENPFQVIIN